jgi:hypothetical protein
MLVVDNVLSGVLVTSLWWLAHHFGGERDLLGRALAVLGGILGVLVLANATFRNVPEFLPWLPYSLLVSKAALAAACALLALRMARGEHVNKVKDI